MIGLEKSLVKSIDWSLALRRVRHDLRSDFIYAPHFGLIFQRAGDALIDELTSSLSSGQCSPGLPLTMEVPKSFRIRVATQLRRLGPNYSRPGSILFPRDRLLYQALADQAVEVVRAKTDIARSFSHLLAKKGSDVLFLPTRTCWRKLQEALASYADLGDTRYILKLDVANFFGSLNQHTLINTLADGGYPSSLGKRLEEVLLAFTGDRSSRSILQGIYPSDLLGNFYLTPVDRFLKEKGVPSARYVDDLYVFVHSVDEAERLMRDLIPLLRSYDLVLNEAKSVIMPKAALVTEEPDLETLFAAAVEEVSAQVDDDGFSADYGFQSEWEFDEDMDDGDVQEKLEGSNDEDDDLHLAATSLLFDSISEYPGQEENIERFCIPLFTAAESDYAVKHVLDSFQKRPAMSQIYVGYLAKFLNEVEVTDFLLGTLTDSSLVDWQKMWVLAALMQNGPKADSFVKVAEDLLRNANLHEGLRAAAAIFIGTRGDYARRKSLKELYSNVSPYVQLSMYYSSVRWPKVERDTANKSWGGHSPLHQLLTSAMKKAS